MAADTIAFPTFSDFSRQAREIERSMLQPKASQISGSLQAEGHAELFPSEFEDYTAAYLVSEAHKIERKIFASNYQTEIALAPAGQASAAGPLPADELHQFASAQPGAQGAPAVPKTGWLQGMFKKGGAPAPQQAKQASSAPPEIPASVRAPEQPAYTREKPAPEPSEEPVSAGPAPQAPPDEEPVAEEEEKQELAEPQPASSKLMASSKISPRLRAIIEEKLRREEQKPEEEKVEIEKAPEAEEEEKQDEMPIMSSHERLLRRIQRQGGPAPAAQEEAAAPEAPPAEQEGEAAPDELPEEGQKEIPAARKMRASSRIQPAEREEAEAEPEDLQQGQAEKEEASIEAQQQEQRIRAPRRAPPASEKEQESEGQPEAERQEAQKPSARPGSITITPIFAGEAEESAEAKPPVQEEGSERMDRIRRIMNELSPDKMKAGIMPPRRADQGEAEEENAEPKIRQEEEEPEKKKPSRSAAILSSVPVLPEEDSPAAARALAKAKPAKAPATSKKHSQQKAPARKLAGPVPETFGEALARADSKKRRQAVPIAAKASAAAPAKEPEAKRPIARKAAAQPVKQEPAARPISSRAKAVAPAEEEPEAVAPVSRKAVAVPRVQVPQAKARPAAQGAIPFRVAEAAAQAKVRPSVQPVQRAARMQPAVAVLPRAVQARAAIAPVRPAPQPSLPKRYAPVQPSESRAAVARPRILPGGISGAPQPKTYVPPLRQKPVPEQEPVSQQEQIEKEPQEEEEQPVAVSSARAKLKAGQQAIHAPVKQAAKEEPQAQSQSVEKAAGIQAPPSAKKEISGEAELPSEQDELEVPKPPAEEAEPVPPQEYEQAKEGLKRKIQQEEIKEKTKEETEGLLEAYAKENLVWLHEIYSMGGIPKEDFLQQVREKMAEAGKQSGPAPEAPSNPALANLGKEIDKKYKK